MCAENICASVKRDLAELCQSSGTLQALVPPPELGAGRPAELTASIQVGRAVDEAGSVLTSPAREHGCTASLCHKQPAGVCAALYHVRVLRKWCETCSTLTY